MAAVAAGCSSGDDRDASPASTAPTTAGSTTTTTIAAAAALCAAGPPVQIGTVSDPDIVELSGIAASRLQPGKFWVHNDSGDIAQIFGIDRNGDTSIQLQLPGVTAIDWEDIAVNESTLYIGDIGDNLRVRDHVTVYDAPEPSMTAHNRDPTLSGVHARELTYPDGPHDAEALMIDPLSNQTVIVTKEQAGTSGVYGRKRATSGRLTLLTKLDLGVGELVTAGDISAEGRVVVLRTYGRVHVWDRAPHESLADAFARPSCEAPAPSEPQGEAIALDPDGQGYVAASEGAAPPLFEVRAKTN